MDIKIATEQSGLAQQENQQPLLGDAQKQPKTPAQKVMRKTFKGTAHLSKLLPTGTVLAFQLLSPILTHQGKCHNIVNQYMTLSLLSLCSISCFFLCFTDSFRDERGKVRYGLATRKGFWIIDGSVKLPYEEAAKYKIKFIDFVHAFMSVLVFAAVGMVDQNVVGCFFPVKSEEIKELLVALPVAIGVICGMFFVAFPSYRHGIGFPLSRN
ncbi:DUF679 domain-containing protein [Cephalotus follicularis]|uniref:DUF679 domain-containing protein n=1 Tax=Cephalotus follicularis TaxID=3775 RepID=A0A1Q3C1F0_CEPFO|nr:DUF679 domain-containing protein [Cephalotus follicularis]